MCFRQTYRRCLKRGGISRFAAMALLCGSPDLALVAARKALEIVDRTNLGAVRDKVLLYYFYACLVNGELETAR